MKSSRLSRLSTTVKNWFDRSLTRHVFAGLIVLTLQNVLISKNIPAPVAAQISQGVGALIEGKIHD